MTVSLVSSSCSKQRCVNGLNTSSWVKSVVLRRTFCSKPWPQATALLHGSRRLVPSLVHRLENKPIDIPRVLLPALEACSIQIQTRINGRRVRRTKQVVEIVGIDPNSMEVITNEVFRWDVTNDDFIFSGKSYVLEKIMVKINYSQEEMRRELRTRKRILEWMVLNDIRKADQVSQIVTEYYVRPNEILARVDGLK